MFEFDLVLRASPASIVAFKCSSDVANYLKWWQAPSYHPPPEPWERAPSQRSRPECRLPLLSLPLL